MTNCKQEAKSGKPTQQSTHGARSRSYTNANAYGKLYGMGYDGHVYAYDVKTGDLVWSFYVGDAGAESPWGTWAFWGAPVIADGKVYAGTTEHTPTQPRMRGNKLLPVLMTQLEKRYGL